MIRNAGRARRRTISQINVVPYIDVMLVLLVIFMITAPLINPGQIELPTVGKTSTPPLAPLEVSIHKDQSLWLRDHSAGAAELRMTREDLIAAIQRKQKVHRDQAVVISADEDVQYKAVLEVMDMLQQNQVSKVGLLAKPRGAQDSSQ